MIVEDFIKWLQTQDQGATVEVLQVEYDGYDTYIYTVEFNPGKHAEYLDMRGNKLAAGKLYENSRTLCLGRNGV